MWDTIFVWKYLMYKTSMGHIVVLLSSNMYNLTGLFIIPVVLLPQEVLLIRLIYG